MDATTMGRILTQLQMLAEITDDGLGGITPEEVVKAAEKFLENMNPEEEKAWEWPEDQGLGRQNRYLEALYEKSLDLLGQKLNAPRLTSVPGGGSWSGVPDDRFPRG